MKNTSFFLTSHQRHDSGMGIPEETLKTAPGTESRQAVETLQGSLGFHSTKTLTQTCQVFKERFQRGKWVV